MSIKNNKKARNSGFKNLRKMAAIQQKQDYFFIKMPLRNS
tara:strand:+ start:4805 stop:4924 length:120 start_codon:yes stop_codon:yes gene_type:complete